MAHLLIRKSSTVKVRCFSKSKSEAKALESSLARVPVQYTHIGGVTGIPCRPSAVSS